MFKPLILFKGIVLRSSHTKTEFAFAIKLMVRTFPIISFFCSLLKKFHVRSSFLNLEPGIVFW